MSPSAACTCFTISTLLRVLLGALLWFMTHHAAQASDESDSYYQIIANTLSGIASEVTTAAAYPELTAELYRFKNQLQQELDQFVPPILNRTPQHIALILDGNRRWADAKGYSDRSTGHLFCALRVAQTLAIAKQLGFEQVTLYMFSTENFKRSEHEVGVSMALLKHSLHQAKEELLKSDAQVRHLGRREGLPADALAAIDQLVEVSSENTGLKVNMAINYGGTVEVEDAIRRIISAGIQSDDQPVLPKFLYSGQLDGWTNPDLIIRTGKEKRSSNFLPMQSVYSEWSFRDELWPDFTPEKFSEALQDFSQRKRRYGQ
ncbi:polyprenyl diphosphate synthase [Parendozoicomonas haliclonae]|uniref:Ditrans,polycis-undecaprenyl-diphosphate synthase ((2E,6E)-farnesyl-diphosphate specific) n=1 Tax=Parendozoicomonas haliclonae TaxID=1960125 RepID=A0A1X7AHG8_9GAMM|nr:polyprenyl diphosphate synthase [Parendozoicomonas haliclonae]SMA42814.1 Isoprenyl transferase [Parendozoicomonas haliclonae]